MSGNRRSLLPLLLLPHPALPGSSMLCLCTLRPQIDCLSERALCPASPGRSLCMLIAVCHALPHAHLQGGPAGALRRQLNDFS